MKRLSTNGYAGYDSTIRSNYATDALFRVMAVMAIAEGEKLMTISPSQPAKILPYNPTRQTQNYLAELTGFVIDRGDQSVGFSISKSYGAISAGQLYVYCNGRISAITYDGTAETIWVEDWYEEFEAAVRDGALREDETVPAHLLVAAEIDMYADWSGVIKMNEIPAKRYEDVPARVKSGSSRD